MRFKLAAAWIVNGQYHHEAGKEFDLGDRAFGDAEFWRAHGLLPPVDACAMDLECAVVMHKAYLHVAHRLYRRLSEADEQEFQKLLPSMPRM